MTVAEACKKLNDESDPRALAFSNALISGDLPELDSKEHIELCHQFLAFNEECGQAEVQKAAKILIDSNEQAEFLKLLAANLQIILAGMATWIRYRKASKQALDAETFENMLILLQSRATNHAIWMLAACSPNRLPAVIGLDFSQLASDLASDNSKKRRTLLWRSLKLISASISLTKSSSSSAKARRGEGGPSFERSKAWPAKTMKIEASILIRRLNENCKWNRKTAKRWVDDITDGSEMVSATDFNTKFRQRFYISGT